MRKTMIAGWVMGALLGLGALAGARDASACGGCFVPTGAENVTVVTDHRMVLSVSPAQTTLYDQIRYSGDPAQFAWVLPIASEVSVGLSADVMFASLDALTRTLINPPPLNCPSPPNCGQRRGLYDAPSAGAAADAGALDNGGVDVTKREVVGPYETVQLKATDPAALELWLGKNGFVIPDDVKPTETEALRCWGTAHHCEAAGAGPHCVAASTYSAANRVRSANRSA